MSDINKRIKHNPYYSTAIKMLGKANFHLYQPECGPSGSIVIHLFVQDKQGRETTKDFTFPSTLNGMAMLQWQPGFKNDIVEMEKAGFRPSRKQFEIPPEATVLPTLKEAVTEKQLEEHQEFQESIPPVQETLPAVIPPPGPRMRVAVNGSLSSLLVLLTMDDRAHVIDDHVMRLNLSVEASHISEFLTKLGQTTVNLVEIKPIDSSVDGKSGRPTRVAEPQVKDTDGFDDMSLSQAIMRVWPANRTVNAAFIREKLLSQTKKWSKDVLTTRVAQVIAGLAKESKLIRVEQGQYKKA